MSTNDTIEELSSKIEEIKEVKNKQKEIKKAKKTESKLRSELFYLKTPLYKRFWFVYIMTGLAYAAIKITLQYIQPEFLRPPINATETDIRSYFINLKGCILFLTAISTSLLVWARVKNDWANILKYFYIIIAIPISLFASFVQLDTAQDNAINNYKIVNFTNTRIVVSRDKDFSFTVQKGEFTNMTGAKYELVTSDRVAETAYVTIEVKNINSESDRITVRPVNKDFLKKLAQHEQFRIYTNNGNWFWLDLHGSREALKRARLI